MGSPDAAAARLLGFFAGSPHARCQPLCTCGCHLAHKYLCTVARSPVKNSSFHSRTLLASRRWKATHARQVSPLVAGSVFGVFRGEAVRAVSLEGAMRSMRGPLDIMHEAWPILCSMSPTKCYNEPSINLLSLKSR